MGTELRREELAELRQVHQQITETKQIFENTASSLVSSIGDIRPPEPASDYLVKAAPPLSAPVPEKTTRKSGRKKSAKARAKKTSARKAHVRTGRK